MIEGLEERFLKFYCRIFFDDFAGTEFLEFDGYSREVFVFEADHILGFSVPWGRIMVNRKLLDSDQEIGLRHIFLHEIGHTETNTLFMAVSGGLQYLLYPLPLVLGAVAVAITAFAGFVRPLSFLEPAATREFFIFLFVLFPVASLISYLGELKAEFFTIDYLGRENFHEAYNQHRKIRPDTGILRKVVIRDSHPSPELVLRIHKFLAS